MLPALDALPVPTLDNLAPLPALDALPAIDVMELPALPLMELPLDLPLHTVDTAMLPIDGGQSMAVDFASAIPAHLDPAEMTLSVDIVTDDDTSFAALDEISFNAVMADLPALDALALPALDALPALAPLAEVPALPMIDFNANVATALPLPELSALPMYDMGFRRRRLAAAGVNAEADVYYHAKTKSAKGGAFKVDIRFSDPSAVKKAKVNFNLTHPKGFKAKLGVALPAQFASASSAKTGKVFADVVLVLFLINMFLIAVTGAGW